LSFSTGRELPSEQRRKVTGSSIIKGSNQNAFNYYQGGYEQGVVDDQGYAGISAALVLDHQWEVLV
jgi:hypothetical protein